MFSDFPSLHPLAVHFPIVLILLATAFQAVITWKLDWVQIRWATLIIMAAAFFSALAASTLLHAMVSPQAPKEVWAVFAEHEKYAQYTLWMSGATLLLKAIGVFYKINRRSYEIVVLGASILSATFLSIAGHHGAKLTHIEGVGPMGRYLGTEEDEMNMENGTMSMNNNSKDSSMTKDSMSVMQSIQPVDSLKDMNNMSGMNMNSETKKIPFTKNEMNKNNNDMSGMNMNSSNVNTKKKNMGGMNMNNNPKNNKDDMSGMNMGADTKSTTIQNKNDDMKGMKMGGMNMNKDKKNAMDTISLEDNNPKRNPK
jgi:uncharacterized membrane protein